MFEDTGSLPLFTSWFNRVTVKADNDEAEGSPDVIAIRPINQKLGPGASLFLMTTKALIWFFVTMSVINIPTMVFYMRANTAETPVGAAFSYYLKSEESELKAKAAQGTGGARIFAELSLGNLKSDIPACGEEKYMDLPTKPFLLGKPSEFKCVNGYI